MGSGGGSLSSENTAPPRPASGQAASPAREGHSRVGVSCLRDFRPQGVMQASRSEPSWAVLGWEPREF